MVLVARTSPLCSPLVCVYGYAMPLIKQFEGCRLRPYQDLAGVWTIGWGATYLANGKRVTATTAPISQDQADQLLATLVTKFFNGVTDLLANDTFGWRNTEVAALTSFAYNLGLTALGGSTLMKLANQGNVQGAADQFPLWCMSNGVKVAGLFRRREAERALFLTP